MELTRWCGYFISGHRALSLCYAIVWADDRDRWQLLPRLPADCWPKDSGALVARVGPQSRQEKKQGTIQEPQTLFCWSSRLASLTPEPAQGGHLGPLNKGTSREHRPSFPTSLKESSICLSSQEKPDFKWGASCPNSVGGGGWNNSNYCMSITDINCALTNSPSLSLGQIYFF